MEKVKPFINRALVLEKFPGKGGWTFARIPQEKVDSPDEAGSIRVKGKIDNHAITNYHLMPMSDGVLFLPVKADLRGIIQKDEGDVIFVSLYLDDAEMETPETSLDCLKQQGV